MCVCSLTNLHACTHVCAKNHKHFDFLLNMKLETPYVKVNISYKQTYLHTYTHTHTHIYIYIYIYIYSRADLCISMHRVYVDLLLSWLGSELVRVWAGLVDLLLSRLGSELA